MWVYKLALAVLALLALILLFICQYRLTSALWRREEDAAHDRGDIGRL
ncbi:hypothetical protein LMG31506_04070 [Cupriavidus yeoncheonensis]|uniref:Uncharacterized protein n=1 Tax=Cupriavidus yeoncheonensis TaxID=1462994 RepID=A0A916IZK3_9BURK|nr:hypothetical protein [Cupriavidus yeoncheonensis]CAG2149647.1 hypothetical protein LMG31506_04070 [Cupriavidus yeoncheonensis]